MAYPRKSIAQKKLEGTYRKDRDSEREETENALSIVLPVKELKISKVIQDKNVKKAYKEHIGFLHNLGPLAEQIADSPLLEQAYFCLQEANRIQEHLSTVDMDSDEYTKLEKSYFRFFNVYERIVKEFFLTPNARTKLKLDILSAKEKETNIEHKSIVSSLLKNKES